MDSAFLDEDVIPDRGSASNIDRRSVAGVTVHLRSRHELEDSPLRGDRDDLRRLLRPDRGRDSDQFLFKRIEELFLVLCQAIGVLEFFTSKRTRTDESHDPGDDGFADEVFNFPYPARRLF